MTSELPATATPWDDDSNTMPSPPRQRPSLLRLTPVLALALSLALGTMGCDYPKVLMEPEVVPHPAAEALARISAQVDQSLADVAPLKRARCENAYEWKGSMQRYVAAALNKDGDAARRAASQLYRYVRCVSAKDFAQLHKQFFEAALEKLPHGDDQLRAAVDEILAPIVFMLHDMGGRSISQRYRRWLLEREDQLLRASANPQSFLRAVGMYGAYGEFVREMDTRAALRYIGRMGSLSGRCSFFELVHAGTDLLLCPRDCDVLGNFEVNEGLGESTVGRRMQQVCSAYNSLNGATGGELRGGIRKCVESYASRIGRDDVSACIDHASRESKDSNKLHRVSFRRQIHLLNDCSVPQAPSGAAAIEERSAQLREELTLLDAKIASTRKAVKQLDEVYERCLDFGHGQACAVTLGNARNSVNETIRKLLRQKQEKIGQSGQLKSRSHCTADGRGCSTSCSIAGQLLQDLGSCYAASDNGTPQAVSDKPLLEVPAGKLPADSPLKPLASCLEDAFASAGEEPHCNTNLVCGDDKAPTQKGNACSCGPDHRAVLSRPSCASVIQCSAPDKLCTCDGIELANVYGDRSSAPLPSLFLELAP